MGTKMPNTDNPFPPKLSPAKGLFVQRTDGPAPQHVDVLEYAKQSGVYKPLTEKTAAFGARVKRA